MKDTLQRAKTFRLHSQSTPRSSDLSPREDRQIISPHTSCCILAAKPVAGLQTFKVIFLLGNYFYPPSTLCMTKSEF